MKKILGVFALFLMAFNTYAADSSSGCARHSIVKNEADGKTELV